jgi:hypothetical protein
MISLTSIGSILGSFKGIKDAAESMVSLRDEVVIMGKVGEINSKLIDAQNGIFSVNEERSALVQAVSDLEKEIADLKGWIAEKQRYRLICLAPNVMAYALKPSEQASEPIHLLCANCYTDDKKSFLNQHVNNSRVDKFHCNRCKETLIVDKDPGPRQMTVNRNPGGRNEWLR